CAHLVEGLLRACPQLRVLATSREGMGMAGEQLYRVPSLSVPDTEQGPTVDGRWSMGKGPDHQPSTVGPPPPTIGHQPAAILQSEAVQLFCERANSVQPSFNVTPATARAVAHVCSRLDGIPLAIELAAARMHVLSIEQIAARLDDRFRLLTGGNRTALPRHQTLRALIDWSYDLLAEPDRMLLRRLSVFLGGSTLHAPES